MDYSSIRIQVVSYHKNDPDSEDQLNKLGPCEVNTFDQYGRDIGSLLFYPDGMPSVYSTYLYSHGGACAYFFDRNFDLISMIEYIKGEITERFVSSDPELQDKKLSIENRIATIADYVNMKHPPRPA